MSVPALIRPSGNLPELFQHRAERVRKLRTEPSVVAEAQPHDRVADGHDIGVQKCRDGLSVVLFFLLYFGRIRVVFRV